MQITKTQSDPTTVELKITADNSDLEPIKRHVLRHFVSSTKVPGFRTGHAPLALVEKHANQVALNDEFLQHALNELYNKALENERIRPLSEPKVSLKKFVPYSNMEFTAEIDTIGKITLADYKKIKVAKPVVSVTTKDVNEVVEQLRKRSAERTVSKQPAVSGDEVIIDFAGFDKNDKPVAGTETKNYPLLLGESSFIPGFEDELVGVKAGENRILDVTFPIDYQVITLQGEKVTFKVAVKTVNKLKLPKLDESFTKKTGPFKTVAELKLDIKKQLTIEKSQQLNRQHQDNIVRQISDASTLDIPPGLVEEQLLSMEEGEKRDLAYKGQSWEEHLKSEGVTLEQHRGRHRKTAEERVKAGLVLSEISLLENINVTKEEIDDQIVALKAQYNDPQMQAGLNKPEARNDIASRIITEKTVAKLVEYASN